jgi:hypothetical protein
MWNQKLDFFSPQPSADRDAKYNPRIRFEDQEKLILDPY